MIEPDVAVFEYDDFKRAGDLVRAGEEAMRKALPEVRRWMESPEDVALPRKTGVPTRVLPAVAKPAPMPAD